jgi:pimeloyl-ACP methyl ester carboxylesterase
MNQKLARIDKGNGDAIIVVHGTPTSSAEYENVINELSQNYRCIALDHLGFGKSAKPIDGDYSLQAHQDRFLEFLKELNLSSFHLVCHDFGAVIALSAILVTTVRPQSITILNSWLWPLIETEPQLKNQKWLVSSGTMPALYRYFNFSPRVLLKLAWGKKQKLSKERHQFYMNAFPNRSSREGPTAFLKTLFDFNHPIWQNYKKLSLLNNIPKLIIWGAQDKLLSIKNLERWKIEIPKAKFIVLDDVGHFVAEEDPDNFKAILHEFFKSI